MTKKRELIYNTNIPLQPILELLKKAGVGSFDKDVLPLVAKYIQTLLGIKFLDLLLNFR
jgi:hypothetical protein